MADNLKPMLDITVSKTDKSSPSDGSFPTWPPNWPEIADSIARAVQRGDWGRYRGQASAELNARIRQICQVSHCRLVSSGSLGIELALRACGISSQDRVVVCGYDYPGNFRAVELLGALPVLVDAAATSFSVDPEPLQQIADRHIRAVIVSHLYGVPAEIQAIREICDRKGWKLIEDACQTPAMNVQGRPAGSWGDVGVLSFGGSKPLTSGNGGALLTNCDLISSKLNAWIDRPSDSTALGDLQAAALLPQLDRLSQCNQIRWETVEMIFDQVEWMRQAIGDRSPSQDSTFYKLAFQSDQREPTLQRLASDGLPVGPGYRSMHRSSARRCEKIGDLERCRLLGEQVCLLDHSALLSTQTQREKLVTSLRV